MSVFSCLRPAARLSTRMRLPKGRRYGSAAAVQWDCDYDDLEDEVHMTGMEGWETVGRGFQWVIMGDPMVNRHVYAERLEKLLEVPHISMSSLVRQELNPNSLLYKQIASSVNQGKLVPEDVIFGLLSKRLEEGYCRGESGFILDGIPRTRVQAFSSRGWLFATLHLQLRCHLEGETSHACGTEEACGRILQATEETSRLSSGWCTWRCLARSSGCIAATAHEFCLVKCQFVTEIDCMMMAN